MKRGWKGGLVLLVPLLLAVTATVAFRLGQSGTHGEMADLRDSLRILLSQQQEAYVVKRVSEQMGDIASQQRAKAEEERLRAEQQAQLAEENAARAQAEQLRAEQQAKIADENALRAETEKTKADAAREDALVQRDAAEHAKAVSDTMTFRTLGRTLGSTSSTVRESGHEQLADQLAYTSWRFLSKYKGNTYVAESFKSLVNATDQLLQTKLPTSELFIKLIPVPGKDGQCVAATNSGEVFVLTRQDATLSSVRVFNDPSCDFRSVWAGEKAVYALSLSGTLLVLDYSGKKQREIPVAVNTKQKNAAGQANERFTILLQQDAHHLLLFGQKSVYRYDIQSATMAKAADLEQPPSAAVRMQDRVCLFYEDGSYGEMDKNGKMEKRQSPVAEVAKTLNVSPVVTAASYDEQLGCLAVGLKGGLVLPLNNDFRVMEQLTAHVSRCTDVAVAGTTVVSSSYDKSIYVWSMDHLMYGSGLDFWQELKEPRLSSRKVENTSSIATEWLVPVRYDHGTWVLSVCADNDGKTVWYATADGDVRNLNVTVDDMADRLTKKLDSTMSRQEWERYVGRNIPYLKY